jgi:hypothetical protein
MGCRNNASAEGTQPAGMENLTEPEDRNRKSTTDQDTSKAIYYIQRRSLKTEE